VKKFKPLKIYSTSEQEEAEFNEKYTSDNKSWKDIVIEVYGLQYWVLLRMIYIHRKFLLIAGNL